MQCQERNRLCQNDLFSKDNFAAAMKKLDIAANIDLF